MKRLLVLFALVVALFVPSANAVTSIEVLSVPPSDGGHSTYVCAGHILYLYVPGFGYVPLGYC